MRLVLACLVPLVVYAVWTDIRVRARFEGARWAVPARIYARPLELYTGLAIDPQGLAQELNAAGYRRVKQARRPGSYRRSGNQFEIVTRAFRYWDGEEPARRIAVSLAGGRVSALGAAHHSLALARLDPALIGRIYPGHAEDRILVHLADVPAVLIEGLVAVEDRGFYSHHGVSLRGIARAAWANIRAGATVQGGSTLTQQLAKNLYLSPRRSVWRKLNEAGIALVLEARYDKRAILEAYLNEIYLGQDGRRSINGFGLASWFYFGRRLDELQTHEVALLIGMVRGASAYNPRRRPERALARRNLVLDIMERAAVISPRTAARARRAPLGVIAAAPKGATAHPAFLDLVRAQLARDYRERDLRTEGLQIFTTLSPLAQRRAESMLSRGLAGLERRRRLPTGSLQGAVVLARPDNGEVLAVVGDREPRARGFNRALHAVRPIGSLVKPAVYLAALESGGRFNLATTLSDRPITVRRPGQAPWSPKNYDGRSLGALSFVEALATSNNLATVRLGLDIGLGAVIRTLRRLGIERPLPEVPSLLLGAIAMTPLEVAQMYQSLANQGFQIPLRAIREVVGADGKPLARYGLRIHSAASIQSAYMIRYALKRAVTHGTARSIVPRLARGASVAGKTGTTDDLRDSWFAGFSDDLLGVVWVGRDDNHPAGLTGASGALQIWADLVPRLAGRGADSRPPDGVVWRWTDLSVSHTTERGCPGATALPFRVGSEPPFAGCSTTPGQGLPDPAGQQHEEGFYSTDAR